MGIVPSMLKETNGSFGSPSGRKARHSRMHRTMEEFSVSSSVPYHAGVKEARLLGTYKPFCARDVSTFALRVQRGRWLSARTLLPFRISLCCCGYVDTPDTWVYYENTTEHYMVFSFVLHLYRRMFIVHCGSIFMARVTFTLQFDNTGIFAV